MRNSSLFSTLAVVGFSLFLGVTSSRADGFSWSGITYAPTPTVAGQVTSLGSGGGTNSVSVQILLNNGATFLTVVPSPAVDSYNTNGTYYTSGGNANPAARFLQVGADMVNSSSGIGSITVNLFFATPITNAQFSFFDVDINATGQGAYVDQINNIYGLTSDGTKVPIGSLVGSASNTVSGTGLSYAVTATANNTNNLAAANATATFTSATPIVEISYTYGDAYTGAAAHGTAQITALSNLSFTSVPEPGTWAWIGLGVGSLFLVTGRRHNKRGPQSKTGEGL